jgi:hypothetical protein
MAQQFVERPDATHSEFPEDRHTQWILLISLLLFVVTLWRYWVPFDPHAFVPRDPESARSAWSLYEHGALANPFCALDTGPSSHLSPVFPTFLALIMKLFGVGSVGMYAIILASIIVLSIELALFPVMSRIFGMGEITGIIGASIWLAAKPKLVYGWEALYAGGLIAAACCCYRLYLEKPEDDRRKMAWSLGALMGFTILTIPTVGVVYAVWMLWEIGKQKTAFLRQSFVPLVLVPFLVLAPWIIRNHLTFHRFVPVRDDIGLELAVSNNDCARFSMNANMESGCFDQLHPNKSLNEARKVRDLGEAQYNKMRLHEAGKWIHSHPKGFLNLTAERFVAFWLPTETFTLHHYTNYRKWERLGIYAMTMLSLPGLFLLYRRDPKSWVIAMSCLSVFPLTYYVIQSEYRYRYPVLWVSFLLGALPIRALVASMSTETSLVISRSRAFFSEISAQWEPRFSAGWGVKFAGWFGNHMAGGSKKGT